jgi:hypothetical protein
MHCPVGKGMIFITIMMGLALGVALNQIRVMAMRLHNIEEYLYHQSQEKNKESSSS